MNRYFRTILSWVAVFAVLVSDGIAPAEDPPVPIPIAIDESAEYFDAVESHFDRLILYSTDHYGRTRSGMWVGSIDIRSNELLEPEQAEAFDWRYLPGSHLYLDQPLLLAAYELGKRSGCKCYPDAADSYIRSYLHLAGPAGDMRLQQDIFFNVRTDQLQKVIDGNPQFAYHTPAWELQWKHDRQATRRMIQSMVDAQLKSDKTTVAGTVFAMNSLLWLMNQNDEQPERLSETVLQLASKCVQTSHRYRELAPAEMMGPAFAFGASACRAQIRTGNQRFGEIAESYVKDFLHLRIDGRHRFGLGGSQTTAVLSTLDYQVAEGCLTMYELTEKKSYLDEVKYIAEATTSSLNVDDKQNCNAEHYGRAIHFLARAAEVLERREFLNLAYEIGDAAVSRLYVKDAGMFRSRAGVDRCDAADGPGWLLLALLYLDGDDATEGSALRF